MNVDGYTFSDHVQMMDRFIALARHRDDTLFDDLAALSRQEMVTVAASAFAALAAYQSRFGIPSLVEMFASEDDEAVPE